MTDERERDERSAAPGLEASATAVPEAAPPARDAELDELAKAAGFDPESAEAAAGTAPMAAGAAGPRAVGRPSVNVKLERFEGPLDLLLHLIKRDEIDIYDIPISHITKQYLDYLELMRALDLEVAGDFLVMAATLMRIKAKLLLPVQRDGDDEDEGDPREELVQRLIEYKQFKEAAEKLKLGEAERRLLYERGMVPTEDDAGPLPLAPATLFDLMDALNRVLRRVPQRVVYEVHAEQYSVEDKMSLIARTVAEDGQWRFSALMAQCRARLEIIVSFMALLELTKLGHIIVVQEANFDDILILPKLPGGDEAHAPVESATRG